MAYAVTEIAVYDDQTEGELTTLLKTEWEPFSVVMYPMIRDGMAFGKLFFLRKKIDMGVPANASLVGFYKKKPS